MKDNDSFINKSMDKFVSVYGHIFRKISNLFAIIIASIFFMFYQIFIQILWLGIAIKFVEFIVSFNILKKIDTKVSTYLQKTKRWESFFIFIIPLIPMEYFALKAGIAFVDGNIGLGFSLYALKFACAIPVSYIYKHTKKELLNLGSYKSFDISYKDEEFFIAHENQHTQFHLNALNIPLGWISLPKFFINIFIYLVKNSKVFKKLSLFFKQINKKIKEIYSKIKQFIFSRISTNNRFDFKNKIKKLFNKLNNKFNKKNE